MEKIKINFDTINIPFSVRYDGPDKEILLNKLSFIKIYLRQELFLKGCFKFIRSEVNWHFYRFQTHTFDEHLSV